MRITQERADELRRKAEKATKGPWQYDDRDCTVTYHHSPIPLNNWTIARPQAVAGGSALSNTAHIAAANPATMLDLLADRDELLAEVERLREASLPNAVDDEYRSLDHAMQILRGCLHQYSGEQAQQVAKALRQWNEKWRGATDTIGRQGVETQRLEAEVAKLRAKCEERKAVLRGMEHDTHGQDDGGRWRWFCSWCCAKEGEIHKTFCPWKRAMEDA